MDVSVPATRPAGAEAGAPGRVLRLGPELAASVAQTWPPFLLVAGLLLIGNVASEDGLFEAIGARLARARLGPVALLVALLGLDAVVTAILNLDTAVVFLTPVLVHAARHRGLDEEPFLLGSVFMANAASLLLPGSNLTNLLVVGRHAIGSVYARGMVGPWLVSCLVTAIFVVIARRPSAVGAAHAGTAPALRVGAGAVATLAAAAAVLALRNAALPVLAIGVAALALRRLRPRLDARAPAALFLLAVAVGTLARSWHGPARLLAAVGPWPTAGLGAVASVLVNNLPAAVLFSAEPPPHARALLLGLDLGPNLAVTGSLSAVLWIQAARSVDARVSIVTYSRLGILLVPLSLAAALAVAAI